MLNVKAIIVSKKTSHCAGSLLYRWDSYKFREFYSWGYPTCQARKFTGSVQFPQYSVQRIHNEIWTCDWRYTYTRLQWMFAL